MLVVFLALGKKKSTQLGLENVHVLLKMPVLVASNTTGNRAEVLFKISSGVMPF